MIAKYRLIALVITVMTLQTIHTLRKKDFISKTDVPRVPIDYETMYFSQKVDHFNFANDDVFNQRYLVANQYWDQNSGPIFFYTGNEGDIDWFCNSTGLMWEWAPQFNALLIFAEHRYYGHSMPYGNSSFKDTQHLGYFTVAQALADFATLIDFIKSTTQGAAQSPVIAFGGSYGGMLAAWLRMKYPHVVVGSLAASAPIWHFSDLIPCGFFYKTVTKDFKDANPICAQNIRKSWDIIDQLSTTAEGRQFMTQTLHLCTNLTSVNDSADVKDWLDGIWSNLAMVDYPYTASFLEPLPPWPVKAVCATSLSKPDLDSEEMIEALAEATNIYLNYSGKASCFKLDEDASTKLGTVGWEVQSCAEMVSPMCADGINDMFPPQKWDLAEYIHQCWVKYNITPRPHWILRQFGGKNMDAYSNIIFSNGLLDPWAGAGVLTSLSDSLVAIVIEEGAHHLDLRGSNPADPPSVRLAREEEKIIVTKWINEYKTNEHNLKHGTKLRKTTDSRGAALWVVCGLVLGLFVIFLVAIFVKKQRRYTVIQKTSLVHIDEKDSAYSPLIEPNTDLM